VSDLELRREIIATARALNQRGLNRGTSGNISVRLPQGFLVTPTGLPYDATQPEDLVLMEFDGTAHGSRLPSSEWRFHRDILAARNDLHAVVHVHSTFATTLACLGMGVPAFHYMIAVAGGKDIRCAPYATFGTQELSDHAVHALQGRKACLLANHGLIAGAESLSRALAVAVEVEALCEQYWRALQIGPPALLSDAEMHLVLEKFRTYGQPVLGPAT
jgi:L-fuculose-phosphate aldolase